MSFLFYFKVFQVLKTFLCLAKKKRFKKQFWRTVRKVLEKWLCFKAGEIIPTWHAKFMCTMHVECCHKKQEHCWYFNICKFLRNLSELSADYVLENDVLYVQFKFVGSAKLEKHKM